MLRHAPAREFSWTDGLDVVTDSGANDRYMYVNTSACAWNACEWTGFGPGCYALGVVGKLVGSRSAAVRGASVAPEAPQLTTRA